MDAKLNIYTLSNFIISVQIQLYPISAVVVLSL